MKLEDNGIYSLPDGRELIARAGTWRILSVRSAQGCCGSAFIFTRWVGPDTLVGPANRLERWRFARPRASIYPRTSAAETSIEAFLRFAATIPLETAAIEFVFKYSLN